MSATHVITRGHGPVDAGGWPLATCTCGWLAVSKDEAIVNEAIEDHYADTGTTPPARNIFDTFFEGF